MTYYQKDTSSERKSVVSDDNSYLPVLDGGTVCTQSLDVRTHSHGMNEDNAIMRMLKVIKDGNKESYQQASKGGSG